jgi:diadenosine tetraphosphate (Ap4A) HIT family hydrolase
MSQLSEPESETGDIATDDGRTNHRIGEYHDESNRYDCRAVYNNFEFVEKVGDSNEIEVDGDSQEVNHASSDGITAQYRCGQWPCYCCGYRMRMNLVEEVERLVSERPEMRRFLTLTLDRTKVPREVRENDDALTSYLMETWRKFREYVKRDYGDFSYLWVKENGDENEKHWHLHVLVSRYLEQEWISEAWSAVGGGEVVDIRRVSRCEKVAHYLGKYLTQNALSGFPDQVQRYGTSEDIDLAVRSSESSEKEFELMMWDYTGRDGSDVLQRPVERVDFIAQRENGGPLGKDRGPPD